MCLKKRRDCSAAAGDGFSLVELLVVITVIVILIALLVPALGMARGRSRQAQCASNQRQVWSAWTRANSRNSSQPVRGIAWTQRLSQYIQGGTAVLLCPDDVNRPQASSYGFNANAWQFRSSPDADRIVLLDYKLTEAKVIGQTIGQLNDPVTGWPGGNAPRHFQLENVTLGDGHGTSYAPGVIDPRFCAYYAHFWRPESDQNSNLAECFAVGTVPPEQISATTPVSSTSTGGAGTTTGGAGTTTGGTSTGGTTTGGTTTGGTSTGGTTTGQPSPPAPGILYWLEYSGKKLVRSNADGTNRVTLISTPLLSPARLTIDHGAGKIYFTDSDRDTIYRANLDGTNLQSLVTFNFGPTIQSTLMDIALDPAAGKMYFVDTVDYGHDGLIRRANLDGTNVETILATRWPYCLGLDTAAGKIYWSDFNNDKICRMNLNGTGVETIATAHFVTAMTVDTVQQKIYYKDRYDVGSNSYSRIYRCNLDGSNVELLIGSGLGDVRDFYVDSPTGKLYIIELSKIWRANLDGSQLEPLVTSGISAGFSIDMHR